MPYATIGVPQGQITNNVISYCPPVETAAQQATTDLLQEIGIKMQNISAEMLAIDKGLAEWVSMLCGTLTLTLVAMAGLLMICYGIIYFLDAAVIYMRPIPDPPMPADPPQETQCAICWDGPKTHAFIPCGHKCLCQSCAVQARIRRADHNQCPICRTKFKSIVRIFE